VVLIEPATKTDLKRVIQIARDNVVERYDDSLFFSMLELAGDTFLVARDPATGQVAGFALAVKETPYEARLIVIAVAEEYQNRNIGHMLMKQIERRVAQKGALELSLEAREENVRAISFYRTAGYEVRAGVPRYYADGARAVVMRKGLR
jgi:[ribosomal protein S18]-alanine N-acetyltransferase